MSVLIENKETFIQIVESGRSVIVTDFDEGSHMSIFFPGGHSSVGMSREETEALIEALQRAIAEE